MQWTLAYAAAAYTLPTRWLHAAARHRNAERNARLAARGGAPGRTRCSSNRRGKFAAAWASLSLVYARRAANGYADVAGEYAKLDVATIQALKLGPSQGDAYSSVAQRQMSIDGDWVAAAATIAKGRQMDPANSALMRNAAVLAVASGQPANATVISWPAATPIE